LKTASDHPRLAAHALHGITQLAASVKAIETTALMTLEESLDA